MTNGNRAILGMLDEIRVLARPLNGLRDLDALVHRAGAGRFVAIGEASHGTHEYYTMRARLTVRLIEEQAFTWIGVEGDWPDCWRINRWVRGQSGLDTGPCHAGRIRAMAHVDVGERGSGRLPRLAARVEP
ncbi:uncharacterized protein Rv2030c/MT2089 [Arthrobacter sp. Hiyo6]|nr:uncharacterized protein Rv2030c/MT2089 [Arthrobacter sp. Hiyo6]